MLDSFTTVSYATTRAFQNLWTKRSSHGSLAASASWAASSPISEVERQIARRGHASRLVSLSSSALCSFGDEGLGANALWRRGEAGAAEAIPPLLSRLNGNNPIPDDGLFWV